MAQAYKMFFCLWVIFTPFKCCVSKQVYKDLIIKHFEVNNANTLVLAHCWNATDVHDILKLFSEHDIRASTINLGLDLRPVEDSLQIQNQLSVIGVIVDLECSRSLEFLNMVSNAFYPMFNATYSWLAFANSLSDSEYLLTTQNLRLDTEFTLAVRGAEYHNFDLYDVYNSGYIQGGQLNMTLKGWWHKNQLQIVLTQRKLERRMNLHGLNFKASVLVNEPLRVSLVDYLQSFENKHLDTMHRFQYNLCLNLKDMFNFRWNITREYSWGTNKNANKTWDGLVGTLFRREADVVITPMRYDNARFGAIHYSAETWLLRTNFFFLHPPAESIRNIFLDPFANSVWISTLVTTCVIILLLQLTFFFGKKFYNLKENVDHNLSSSTLNTLAALFQQGISKNYSQVSTRTIIIFLFVFSSLVYQFYAAYIVSSLLMKPPRTIKTLRNLMDSKLKLKMQDIQYIHVLLKIPTKDSTVQELFVNMNGNADSFCSAMTGMKLIQQGKTAFHVDQDTAYGIMSTTFTEREICDIAIVMLWKPFPLTLAVQHDSPYKELIRFGLRRITETGVLAHHTETWHWRRPYCGLTGSSTPISVGLEKFSSALIALGFGMCIAIIIFLSELYKKKHKSIFKRMKCIILKDHP